MQNTDVAPSFTIAVADFVMPDVVANPSNAIALPIFAFLALLITYLPLRSFYRVKNIAACSMMVVIIFINTLALINGIIWPTDDWTKWWMGYGLCDIEVILRYPTTMALATSLCCLTKGLADALDTEHAVFNTSKAQRRRKVIADVLFCWLVPVLMMALHYTVQAGRYMIIPVWGCADQLDNSWPMLIVIIMWCPIFMLITVYYATLMFFRLYRHRKTISAALTSTGSGLAPRKFIKLVLISIILILIYLPVQSLFVYLAIPSSFVPYSWSRVHDPVTWSPILFVHTNGQPSLQWAGWAGVVMSGFMFAFFGFNDDAVDTYRGLLVKCGAGRLWPSLKLSREERRATETLVNTMSSRSSFKSQFDLVGKAMKYFDAGARKDSHATGVTLVNGSTTASRKGSQVTFSNCTSSLSHFPTTTSTNASLLHKSTASPDSGHHSQSSYSTQHPLQPNPSNLDDEITLAPSPFGHGPYTSSEISPTSPFYQQIHTRAPTTPLQSTLHRGMFSMFRTHVHLPFNMFTSSTSSKSTSKTKTTHAEMNIINPHHIIRDNDIEAQSHTSNSNTSTLPRRPESIPSRMTISTNTCSSPSSSSSPSSPNQQTLSTTKSHSISKSTSSTLTHPQNPAPTHANHNTISEIDDSIDPLSPKLGTRAYRERERREFAAATSQKSRREKSTKDEQSRIFADNVHQELGMHILATGCVGGSKDGGKNGGKDGMGKGSVRVKSEALGGVVVTRSLDIREERAVGSP